MAKCDYVDNKGNTPCTKDATTQCPMCYFQFCIEHDIITNHKKGCHWKMSIDDVKKQTNIVSCIIEDVIYDFG